MQEQKLQVKIKKLRKKYPKFIYQNYWWKISGSNLEIFFDFQVEPDIFFKPRLIVKNVKKNQMNKIGEHVFNNLVFHLGLAEIPSYWKATCSPVIEIRAGFLNKKQIKWFKDMIIKGMGQFFYENRIDFRKLNFLNIIVKSKIYKKQAITDFLYGLEKARIRRQDRYFVPIGGGKDSIVTLESLKKQGKKIGCFAVNPRRAAMETAKIAGIKDKVIVKRFIDKKLLALNQKGFLNGHTPLTAVLSFLAVFGAVLFDYKYVVFSNEKSADEGNLRYLGKIINHQWSKSSEFERKFRNYVKKYLMPQIVYFSHLRKYTELEIAKIFTTYPKYFYVFSSCNRAPAKKSKIRWCGNCSKCLFVWMILYSYLEKEKLFKIFGTNIFQNKSLLPTMYDLLGWGKHKPFECVGTYKESKKALELCLNKAKREKDIPYLLKKFNEVK